MTVKAIHAVEPKELKNGYFETIHEVFDQFGTNHNFDSVHFTYLDGSEFAYAEHNKGPVHTHKDYLGRCDGLKGGFDRLLTDPPTVEVWVDDNILYIKEVSIKKSDPSAEAAKLREMLGRSGK